MKEITLTWSAQVVFCNILNKTLGNTGGAHISPHDMLEMMDESIRRAHWRDVEGAANLGLTVPENATTVDGGSH